MKFKVGDTYKDRVGNDYKFIVHIPVAINSAQAIFMHVRDGDIYTRYADGTCDPSTKHVGDILPHEKKTMKLYPALYKSLAGRGYYITDHVFDIAPEHAVRLLTEYPPVIVEVEDDI